MTLIRISRLWLGVATLWTSPAASYALPHDGIFGLYARQATCAGNPSLAVCGNGRPSNWCCPSSTQCLSLNNTGTQAVICCPNGSDCTAIQPISCNMALQDASKYPNASVHTSNLQFGLPQCDSQCCPLGYECATDVPGVAPFCKMLDMTKRANVTSSSTAAASAPTSTSTPPSSPTTSPLLTDQPSKSKTSAAKIVVPVVIVVLALTLLAVSIWLGCWKKSNTRKPISDPIYDPMLSARTDFVNRYRPRNSALPRSAGAESRGMPKTSSPGRPGTSDSRAPLNQSRDNFAVSTLNQPSKQAVQPAAQAHRPEISQNAMRPSMGIISNPSYAHRNLPMASSEQAPRKGPPGATPNPGTYTLPSTRFQAR